MRTHLRLPVVFVLVVSLGVSVNSAVQSGRVSGDGNWVRVAEECRVLFGGLPAASHWTFIANRSLGELWTVNLTVSGTGFHPITLLICDAEAYHQWVVDGSTATCLLAAAVNWSFHGQVAFSHPSGWYLVLYNPWQVSLLFSLSVARYRWTTEAGGTIDPTSLLERLGGTAAWFLAVPVLVLVAVSCGCGCTRKRRRVVYDVVHEEVTD